MRTRLVAAFELLLILPAALFMAALVARNLPPLQDSAQQLVMWYAGRIWTLWVLLLALPLTVLVTGCSTLADSLQSGRILSVVREDLATLSLAVTTVLAGAILVIVVLHMLAN
jgi:hypothetical protein